MPVGGIAVEKCRGGLVNECRRRLIQECRGGLVHKTDARLVQERGTRLIQKRCRSRVEYSLISRSCADEVIPARQMSQQSGMAVIHQRIQIGHNDALTI